MLELTTTEEISMIVGFIITGLVFGFSVILPLAAQLALKRAVSAAS